jgi:tetratricopeptide (TPR) repeat protein
MRAQERLVVAAWALTGIVICSLPCPPLAFAFGQDPSQGGQRTGNIESMSSNKEKAREHILGGDPRKALDLLRRMADESGRDADYFFIMGRALQDLKMNTDAFANYSISIYLDPDQVKAWINRGLARGALQDLAGAIEDFNQALRIEPTNTAALISRGVALAGSNNLNSAETDFSKAIDLNPKLADAYRNRGIARHYLKDKKGACSDWKKAGMLAPEDVWSWFKYFCGRKVQNMESTREMGS